MKGIKVLIILVLCNLLFQHPFSVNAASHQSKSIDDEKKQISYLKKGNLISKNINLDAMLTKKEFFSWLQFLSYDENKNLISNQPTEDKRLKQNIKNLNLLTFYEYWEKTNSLNKQINCKEMFSILYKLLGYGTLDEVQINQLNEIKKLISNEEANYFSKNTQLNRRVGAVLFGRFINQFQSSLNYTANQEITSDKTLFINEGPSSKYKHIIEIPKKMPFQIIGKFGNTHIGLYKGKIGYLSMDISKSMPELEKVTYVVNANKVNLRLGPSKMFPIVKTVNMKDKIIGSQFNPEWTQIEIDHKRAFISSKYIKSTILVPNNGPNKNDAENLVKKVYVLADKLNVREEQSITSRKIGTVYKGETLEVTAKFSKWTKIKTKNIVGFVSNDFITESSEVNVKNIVIAIDAGHGGKDSGTHFNQLNEKDITLETALDVKQSFNHSNVQVVLTRESDVFLDLGERVKIAQSNDALLFVSIHVNSGSGENGGGSETYYYGSKGKNPYISQSRLLATSIQSEMVNAWHLADRGIQHGNFQVIRDNTMPAVLTELGFIDSKKDQFYLSSSQQITIIASAIHEGITNYLQSQGYKIIEK
ncbi:N-acetylmuramoyl-L-alanine amidase [Bacillus sp. EAC]|uniref:N-acetylmuramoyl-L-alanine amidase n=1 Tax=Bacillus sp. EAC TaxID=1978338 RepID=UPI000B44E32B|nr:N-acetylmuramoyl-L-alanine amidase [Bacillus sp. EAC]